MQRHKYTYWTTEELQTLRILRFVEGLPYNEVGIALNRNWQSCCNAVHKYFKKELEDYKRAAIAKRLGLKIPAVDYAIHKKNRLRAK